MGYRLEITTSPSSAAPGAGGASAFGVRSWKWRVLASAIVWLAAFGCGDKSAPANVANGVSGGAPAAAAGSVAAASGGAGSPAEAGRAGSVGARALPATPAADRGVAGSGGAGMSAAPGALAVSNAGAGGSAPSAGSASTPVGAGSGGAAAASPRLPAVTSTSSPGGFETMQDAGAGPKTTGGVFRPKELGKGGVKHPIFVWGCGGGSTPSSYADLLTRVASHGFVAIAEVSEIGDDGAPLKAAIDWMIAENGRVGSVYFEKLDTSKIGLGGHSIGSVNAFRVAADPRLTTSIHVAGGSLDKVDDINAPTTGSGGKSLVHPVAYVCSEMDAFDNVEKTEKDYVNTTTPAFMTVMTGVDHIAAAREGMPVIVAWLRWQLAGENERRSAFLEPMGEFTSGKYVSKHKNW